MKLPHTMTIKRLSATGVNREVYNTVTTAPCFLQPVELESNESTPSFFSVAYRCYTDYDTNVRPKDNVVINGTTYYVHGMREHRYGSWPHKALTLELPK